jgi:DNA-binding NarL/FixJ family response regulator
MPLAMHTNSLVIAVRARIYRDGLAAALSAHEGMTVVGVEAEAAGAIGAIGRCRPDVLLVDVALQGAIELVSLTRNTSPTTNVIALAVRADDHDVELLKWAEAGVAGFVTCDNSVDELLACIAAASDGELACSPRISASLLRRIAQLAADRAPAQHQASLTPRQTRILHLVRQGQSNKQIARELGIEVATVKNHVHHLLQRLHVRHRSEAASAHLLSRDPTPPLA